MKFRLILLFIIIQTTASAGEISKVFNKGVFDTSWGDTLKEVSEVFPDGEIKKIGKITQFEVKDSRTVLGFKRNNKGLIDFTLDSEGRLIAVSINFNKDDMGALTMKLNTLFGEYTKKSTFGAFYVQWPNDNGIILTLRFSMESKPVLVIAYSGLDKPDVSKKELGF